MCLSRYSHSVHTSETESLRGSAQADRIYAQLRKAIMTCDLHPGMRLKVMDIAAQHDVSPGSVREALGRLTTDHLAISQHQRGFRVSELSRSDMLDIYATRAALESDLVARSVGAADPNWRLQVGAAFMALQQQGAAPMITGDAGAVHEDFHRALLSGCGSPWSLRLFEAVYAASERYRYFAYRNLSRGRDVAGEHAELFAAAMRGDAACARELSQRHTLMTRTLLDEALARMEHAGEEA